MVLRERKSDGNKFWGCSSFPKCNGITKYIKGSEKQTTSGGFKPIVEKKVELPTPDSRFQQPILTAFLNEHKNLMVKACAGSGKTTLLKMLSYQLPKHKSIVYVVYNAKIRDEAVKVLPDWVSPMTSHQLGFAAIRNYNGKAKTELDDQKVQNIFKKMIQDSWDEEKWMIAPVCNLVSKLKNTLAPSDNNTLMKVAERFNIDLNDSAFRIFDYVREVLR
jgi:ssDNA-binding Zn-finger/Zn-ribbon topoisomerase 1